MILFNEQYCSKEFIAALKAVQSGMNTRIRRQEWPEGMHLRMDKNRHDCIVVVRPGWDVFPGWHGPSSAESDAADWIVENA